MGAVGLTMELTNRPRSGKADPGNPVVLVSNATTYASTTVRWFPDVWSAERNHVMVTASCRGVSIHTRYLHEVPDLWIESAKRVYAQLCTDPCSDVSYVATYINSVSPNGPLVPVERPVTQ